MDKVCVWESPELAIPGPSIQILHLFQTFTKFTVPGNYLSTKLSCLVPQSSTMYMLQNPMDTSVFSFNLTWQQQSAAIITPFQKPLSIFASMILGSWGFYPVSITASSSSPFNTCQCTGMPHSTNICWMHKHLNEQIKKTFQEVWSLI